MWNSAARPAAGCLGLRRRERVGTRGRARVTWEASSVGRAASEFCNLRLAAQQRRAPAGCPYTMLTLEHVGVLIEECVVFLWGAQVAPIHRLRARGKGGRAARPVAAPPAAGAASEARGWHWQRGVQPPHMLPAPWQAARLGYGEVRHICARGPRRRAPTLFRSCLLYCFWRLPAHRDNHISILGRPCAVVIGQSHCMDGGAP